MNERLMDSEVASCELSDDERRLIAAEIERFARGSVAPLVERPELVLSQQKLDNLTEQAQDIGLLSLDEASGVGLWEQGDAPPSLSVELLTSIAKVNAGVALHFHQYSLARYLIGVLGFPAETVETIEQTAISLTGYYGLGGAALPRYLLSQGEEGGDIDFLRCWFDGDNSTPFVFTASATWQTLLHPSIDSDGSLIFSLYSRQDLVVDEMTNSHGFDELSAFCCQGFGGVKPLSVSSLTQKQSKEIYSLVLQYNALAYMAIALGAVQHAYEIAFDYSAIREQGGAVINRHSAVQLLLAEQRSAIDGVTISLEHLSSKRLSLETISTVFSIRATSHKTLCNAANAAMQSCGGIGYMQDTGLEKIVRDCNALRVTDGTPMELSLFIAEWERLHG